MKTMDFDRIATSAPLDRQASVARDSSGDLWSPKVNQTTPRWAGPPPLKALAPAALATAQEFIGKRFGRLVCLGVWRDGNPKKPAVLVCRCDCGVYEGAKSRSLRSGAYDRCEACRALEKVRRLGSTKNTTTRRKADEALLDSFAKGGVR